MGAYASRPNQTTWSVNVTLDRPGAEITYTLSSTTESLVKVIKGTGGSTITMIVNPLTGEMTLDDKSTGKDGDLTELTTVLKDDLMASIAKRWNMVIEEDTGSESDEEVELDGAVGTSGGEDTEKIEVEIETVETEVEADDEVETEVETGVETEVKTEEISAYVPGSELQSEEEENSDGWDSE